jgi:hypothetical protein
MSGEEGDLGDVGQELRCALVSEDCPKLNHAANSTFTPSSIYNDASTVIIMYSATCDLYCWTVLF